MAQQNQHHHHHTSTISDIFKRKVASGDDYGENVCGIIYMSGGSRSRRRREGAMEQMMEKFSTNCMQCTVLKYCSKMAFEKSTGFGNYSQMLDSPKMIIYAFFAKCRESLILAFRKQTPQ